jgi:beta-glucosidase-like glycosyl hydrolase/CubicO group peptidase (beta-lactamase class C family)
VTRATFAAATLVALAGYHAAAHAGMDAAPPTRVDAPFRPGMSAGSAAEGAEARPGSTTRGWARRTLARLTLPEKVAQMIGVRAFGLYQHRRSQDFQTVLDHVRRLGVGCVVVFESEVGSLPIELNALQLSARVPLLIAADMERGMNFRIRRGVVPLPSAMAVGATRSEEDARFTGEVTAREGRALGVHWAFAPVADVNSNPANPIINVRSYGEDPELVGRMTAAFVKGAHEGGLLATVKHYPGHGDTAADSHLQLATISADRERLDRVELRPFRDAIAAGVDAVMLGHIAVPALDPSGAPATLSEPIAGELRRRLGFEGLLVTDAMEMQGVRAAWTGEAAVRAVRAGADLVLLPPDPAVAIQAIVREVRAGRMPESRIDESVARILAAKERLGLDRRRTVDASTLEAVDRPEDVARALDVARRSITVLRNEGGVLPLHAEQPLRILHLVLSSDARNDAIAGIPEGELAARRIVTQTTVLGPEVSADTAAALVAAAPGFTHVIASAFVRVSAYKGNADMAESHARLLRDLQAAGRPVILLSFGSPYLLRQVPTVSAYVCAYGAADSSQRAAIAAVLGEYPVGGKVPVSLPGFYAYGDGLQIPRQEMTLRAGTPAEAGFRPDGLDELDRVLEAAVAARAFPGAVVAVGKDGILAHLKALGHLTYDEGAAPVETHTIYDLASLTKVIVTTTMAMILVDEGKLDISKPVSAFLPEFKGGSKDEVTVAHLLTHSAGVDWWAPLFKEIQGKEAYLRRILAMDLAYAPGTKSVYSDLGVILLGEILERVAGQDLESFARARILGPLGMKDTTFRPGPELLPRIAPTENDPWRGHVLRGEVHDENAFALGGVAPHAGLFGTAPDLARFAQMLIGGGVLEHQRIVSRETLERFTRKAGVPDSSRALGWDTPSENSSAGSLFGPRSFGHTGFTGTSMWMDPDRKLFVVLLTNRVHPTRENNAIREVRRAVADAVVRGLAQP